MATPQIERRTYRVPFLILYGYCLTALGQMRANNEVQDIERGLIVARVGAGLLAPVSELALTLRPLDAAQTSFSVTWRARRLGGDRTVLRTLIDAIDALAARG
jgi:hypothetical protein